MAGRIHAKCLAFIFSLNYIQGIGRIILLKIALIAVGEVAVGGRDSCSEGVHICAQSCGQQQAALGGLCAHPRPLGRTAAAQKVAVLICGSQLAFRSLLAAL